MECFKLDYEYINDHNLIFPLVGLCGLFMTYLGNKFVRPTIFTLGTMRALESIEQMYSVVKEAFYAGINHIETAPAYGPAEDFLGRALAQLKHEKLIPEGGWVITSKILPGATLISAKQQLKGILSRLKISKLNNLAIH